MKYVKGKEACQILGICSNTLRKLADEGKIETIRISGQRRYNLSAYLGKQQKQSIVCYCRVSSPKQRDDLERQVEYMRQNYPQAEIIKDIGSGLNYKRRGLRAILERAMRGKQLMVVVACKDRLCRFGFDIISWIIEQNAGKVVVLNQISFSPERELVTDLLAIIHVFSCRLHGLRSYKSQINQDLSKPRTEEVVQTMDRK
jgi:predicted site-specific integrase-resolvase